MVMTAAAKAAILKPAQKRHLRTLAHALKPVILVGDKGVTDSVLAELDGALEHHELLKVRVAAEDRAARDALIDRLAEATGASLVQRIGHVACLYRRSSERPRITLPR